mmetsp:Transcript_10669/g.13261  ORF Transcript_10669/g.13261 Transcript_10669/m.13261 type:complete len:238 (-) Transcript_10669:22-735(-)
MYKYSKNYVFTYFNFDRPEYEYYSTHKREFLQYFYSMIYEWQLLTFKHHEKIMFNKNKKMVEVFKQTANDAWFDTRIYMHSYIRWWGHIPFKDEHKYLISYVNSTDGSQSFKWGTEVRAQIGNLYMDTIKRFYWEQYQYRQSRRYNILKNNSNTVKAIRREMWEMYKVEINKRNEYEYYKKKAHYDRTEGKWQGVWCYVYKPPKKDKNKSSNKSNKKDKNNKKDKDKIKSSKQTDTF